MQSPQVSVGRTDVGVYRLDCRLVPEVKPVDAC